MADLRRRKCYNVDDFHVLDEGAAHNVDLEEREHNFSNLEPRSDIYEDGITWNFIIMAICALCISIGIFYVAFFHSVTVGFWVARTGSHLGFHHAQHVLGQMYFQGKGVPKNRTEAFLWFRRAADQGHPHASYNLALGRFKGYPAGISRGEARQYMALAASKGLPQARHVMETICSRGHCDDH